MKKVLFLIWIVGSVVGGRLCGQNPRFEFVKPITTITGNIGDSHLYNNLEIRNVLSADTLRLRCVRIATNLAPGHVMNFCWGVNCYPPNVDSSLTDLVIPPEQIDNTFLTDLVTNGSPGTSTVTYKIYSIDPYTYIDTITLTFVVQDTVTGLSTDIYTSKEEFLKLYPNPAKDFTIVRYSTSASSNLHLVIYDLLGKEKGSLSLLKPSGIIKLDLARYTPGIYFISLRSGRKTLYTRRLVIVRE